MTTAFLDMLKNDEGATLVEYGLVVSLIAVAAIVVIGALGTKVEQTFTAITGKSASPQ